MNTTTTETTVSPIERVMREGGMFGSDHATVTGENGTTQASGCLGTSESGRYRVHFTWKHGAARLGSSRVVEADSGIAAAILVAVEAGGSYLTTDAGTFEAS